MDFPIVHTGISLYLSPAFVQQVDEVIENNVYDNTQLVALFISRLIKGLQNLSNIDAVVDCFWGEHTYTIEDIGIISFCPLIDTLSQKPTFAIESISWTLSISSLFSILK